MIAMEAEIADQTFGLPSRELARTPSPKTPKPGVEAAGKQPGVISAPRPRNQANQHLIPAWSSPSQNASKRVTMLSTDKTLSQPVRSA